MVAEAAVEGAAVVAVSASPDPVRLDLLGVPLDVLTRAEAESRIVEHLTGTSDRLLHVVTLNPEQVVAALDSAVARKAIDEADLVVADGIGIVLAIRCLYDQSIERITGVDLADWILTVRLPETPRVVLLGTPESVAELQGRHPLHVVARWGAGTPDPRDDAESIRRIVERSGNVILVGYGAPAQSIWIERNRDALTAAGVRVAIGVGGALDYLSGTIPRAPEFVRKLGLEWAYRLYRQPWRWRRQLALPRFGFLVVRARSKRSI